MWSPALGGLEITEVTRARSDVVKGGSMGYHRVSSGGSRKAVK